MTIKFSDNYWALDPSFNASHKQVRDQYRQIKAHPQYSAKFHNQGEAERVAEKMTSDLDFPVYACEASDVSF